MELATFRPQIIAESRQEDLLLGDKFSVAFEMRLKEEPQKLRKNYPAKLSDLHLKPRTDSGIPIDCRVACSCSMEQNLASSSVVSAEIINIRLCLH